MHRRLSIAVAAVVGGAGIAFRLVDLGRYGFWNDEAWVALSTRTESLEQFRLSIGHTPVGLPILLRLVPASLPAELALRAVPCLFGCATLVLAWRLGNRIGGPLPALLALATVAVDPLNVAFAKQLKQYTAEGCLAVAALLALHRQASAPSRAALAWLALCLCGGVVFATTQLFVAPPVLVVGLLSAVATRDRRVVRDYVVAAAGITAWLALWYVQMVAPHLVARLSAYFAADFVPVGSASHAVAFVWRTLHGELANTLGPRGWLASAGALIVACHLRPALRPPAIAVALLVIEMIALGLAHQVPFATPRVLLFMYAALDVVLGIGLGCVLATLAGRRWGIPAAIGLGGFVVASAAAAHDWPRLVEPPRIEDVGPLIRRVETERAPDDVVLAYGRTSFIYAYYQQRPPVLVAARNATGFVPVSNDPRVRFVDRTTVSAAADRAFADARVVWFVGSRMGVDAAVLEAALRTRGRLTARAERADALLLRFERPPP